MCSAGVCGRRSGLLLVQFVRAACEFCVRNLVFAFLPVGAQGLVNLGQHGKLQINILGDVCGMTSQFSYPTGFRFER